MNINYSILIFAALLIGFSSCKNNDEVFAPVVNTNLTVINASADTLNFYLNGTRQNNTSNLFPDGAVVDITVPAGLQNYQFKKAGANTALFSLPLSFNSLPASLNDTVYNYSLYIAGGSSSLAFSTLDTVFADTAQNMCTVRFVNASPDAGSLDVFVGDTVNFKARAFKSSSVFLPTGSGLKEVKICQAGTTSPKIDVKLTFLPNQVYTIFSNGLINGTGGSTFNVGSVVN